MYYESPYLAHHGIKGMKWGVRRYQNKDGSLTAAGKNRAARADRNIRKINAQRDANKKIYDEMQVESREIYSGKKSKKLNRALAGGKAIYDTSEVVNKYRIATQEAKKNPDYKKSEAYKSAKDAYTKQYIQQSIYGAWGHQRIETLKNDGYSERKAKGRVFAEEFLASVGVGAAMIGLSYIQSRR